MPIEYLSVTDVAKRLGISTAADSASGALRVPLVDGAGEPAARASDGGVRLGELVGADGGGRPRKHPAE